METSGKNDRSVLDALSRHAATRPNAPAYRTGDKVLSFADVELATNRIANALTAMQVGPGDRVACLTRHHAECLLLTLAACKVGAVCMPVNWRLAPSEVAYIVEHGQASFMMTDEAFASAFLTTVGSISTSSLRNVVCTERAIDGLQSFARWYE